MANERAWIVCETTGRWTAALNIAIERQGAAIHSKRIQELRTLLELHAAMPDAKSAIVLLEVRINSFPAALSLFLEAWRRNNRMVALLGEGLEPEQATEALLEAGALAVISSPRHIGSVIELANRVARASQAVVDQDNSIAHRAWAALPWQDA